MFIFEILSWQRHRDTGPELAASVSLISLMMPRQHSLSELKLLVNKLSDYGHLLRIEVKGKSNTSLTTIII